MEVFLKSTGGFRVELRTRPVNSRHKNCTESSTTMYWYKNTNRGSVMGLISWGEGGGGVGLLVW